jgi:hypothetical protein
LHESFIPCTSSVSFKKKDDERGEEENENEKDDDEYSYNKTTESDIVLDLWASVLKGENGYFPNDAATKGLRLSNLTSIEEYAKIDHHTEFGRFAKTSSLPASSYPSVPAQSSETFGLSSTLCTASVSTVKEDEKNDEEKEDEQEDDREHGYIRIKDL